MTPRKDSAKCHYAPSTMPDHPHGGKTFFPYKQSKPPLFQLMPVFSHAPTTQQCEEPSSMFLATSWETL